MLDLVFIAIFVVSLIILCIYFRKPLKEFGKQVEIKTQEFTKQLEVNHKQFEIENSKKLVELNEELKKLNQQGTITLNELEDLIDGKLSQDDLEKSQLKRALEARGVKYLVHFTQEKNIDSIIKHGLVPRNTLQTIPVVAVCNDKLRLDFRENASCLSIEFPNYKLFWNFRKQNERQMVEWGIIVFSHNVLLEKECLFYPTNAANASVSKLDRNILKEFKAFNKLYDNIGGKPTREELGLADSLPTDPQAEVMVEGVIEPKYILAVLFDNDALTQKYKSKYPHINIRTDQEFFKPRSDYLHWKKHGNQT